MKKVIITEEQADFIKNNINQNNNLDIFKKEVKSFLYNIISDNISEMSDYWRINGIKKGDLYRKLKSYNILIEAEDGKIKIPKKKFDIKIKRLYYELFPDDDSEILISEDDGGGPGDGATTAANSGSYESNLFLKPLRK